MPAAFPQTPHRRTPKAPFAARLFGYDVFISFALGGPPRGSQSYASDLARRLRERDLSVFFSEDELPPGDPLSPTLQRALLRSRMLVVVVNRGTLEQPRWVRTEVEAFRSAHPGRPVVPVCLDGSFGDAALSRAVQPWLQHEGKVWLDEQPGLAAQGLAGEALVQRLLTAPRHLQANTLWRFTVAAVGVSLAGLAAAAVWQAVQAMQERDRVSALRDQALSRQLAAQAAATLVPDPVRALLLAVQAQAVAHTPASEGALLGALSALPVARIEQHASAFQALALAPQGDRLLASDVRGALLQGQVGAAGLRPLVAPQRGLNLYATIQAIAFSADGQAWAQAGSSGEITVHQGAAERRLPDGDKQGEATPGFVFGLAFSPDGGMLAAVSSRGALRLHDLAGGPPRLLLRSPVDLASLAFHPDGRWLAVGGDQGRLSAVPVGPGVVPPQLQSAAVGTVSGLAFDSAGRWLVVASRGGRLEVLDAHSGQGLATVEAPEEGAIEALAVSPDGRFIITGHGNGAVVGWTWAPGQPWQRQTLWRHAGAVRALAFAPGGRRLTSAGQDGRLFHGLPVDTGRWQVASPAAVPPNPLPSAWASVGAASAPRGVPSPDGQWRVWPGTSAPAPAFGIDFSGLARRDLPRLTVAQGRDGRVLLDGVELPGEAGESVVAGPVFSGDSARVVVQVQARSRNDAQAVAQTRDRLLLWNLQAAAPVEGSLALPLGARLTAAARGRPGWWAQGAAAPGSAQPPRQFLLSTDLAEAVQAACALAGRRLTEEEWRLYVGPGRPYAPACAGPG